MGFKHFHNTYGLLGLPRVRRPTNRERRITSLGDAAFEERMVDRRAGDVTRELTRFEAKKQILIKRQMMRSLKQCSPLFAGFLDY